MSRRRRKASPAQLAALEKGRAGKLADALVGALAGRVRCPYCTCEFPVSDGDPSREPPVDMTHNQIARVVGMFPVAGVTPLLRRKDR